MPPPRPPPRGMILGQRYHTLKGLDVGKCHTKFQLSSPEGLKIISCNWNAVVHLHLNLQINLNLVRNVTNARNIMAKRYMPHSCQGRWWQKKQHLLVVYIYLYPKINNGLFNIDRSIHLKFNTCTKLLNEHLNSNINEFKPFEGTCWHFSTTVWLDDLLSDGFGRRTV